MAGLRPTKKVQAGGVAGAIGLVVLFIAKQFSLDMDAETAYAIAFLITLGAAYAQKDE